MPHYNVTSPDYVGTSPVTGIVYYYTDMAHSTISTAPTLQLNIYSRELVECTIVNNVAAAPRQFWGE